MLRQQADALAHEIGENEHRAIVHGRVVLTQQLPRRSGRGRKRRVPPGQRRLV